MKMELQQHTNNQAAKVARTVAAKRHRPRGKITNILISKKTPLTSSVSIGFFLKAKKHDTKRHVHIRTV